MYYFDERERFVIEDYNHSKPFASFLPGIAGKKGIPLWVFYVNRGQCITSFGVRDKDHAIMEFYPAFRAYQNVETVGFRTFIRLNDKKLYEPFRTHNGIDCRQSMHIGLNELELCEVCPDLGLETSVLYFTLPMERVAVLSRKLTVKNLSGSSIRLEIIDGIPALLPYGMNDYGIKHVGNTLRAWMDVCSLESKVPIFKLRSTAEDTVSVSEFEEGNFYLAVQKSREKTEVLSPLVDPNVIFGTRTSMDFPEVFSKIGLDGIAKESQMTSNRVPCAFAPARFELEHNEEASIYSSIGHTPDTSEIDEYGKKFADGGFFEAKRCEANAIVGELTGEIITQTSSKLFDRYCQQTYLDNILRGGYPLVFSEGRRVYHIYSRKHGDPERDYNYFVLLPEYYSSGNGNYRDVNQNRREDVFYNPGVERYNVRLFANLLQADGYNPLIINGVKYRARIERLDFLDEILEDTEYVQELKSLLCTDFFTPGKIVSFIERKGLKMKVSEWELLKRVIEVSEEEVDAVHGEGFWTDHWTYNLDLIESFLDIYPDRKRELLFCEREYTYFDNSMIVLPRNKRYSLVDERTGKLRQYNSLVEDEEKKGVIESRETAKNIMRGRHGGGEIYKTSLIVKLVNLAAVKFATLDPSGAGIEMEAGKPGWYDALNGLPGLFGSSAAEAFELWRLLHFLKETLEEFPGEVLEIPEEVMRLIVGLVEAVEDYEASSDDRKDHRFWETISDIRERYREETKLGFTSDEVPVKSPEISKILGRFNTKLRKALEGEIERNGGIMPTYFCYEPETYEIVEGAKDRSEKCVRIKGFRQKKMPLFLEGVVRGFKVYDDQHFLKEVHTRVRESDLYDRKLKMYKVNAPLNGESIEIGRAKAFTPGWLENESIWLHMEYKYLLELLRSGLYDEFYEDFRNTLVPFMEPAVYGRSPLENSSFIASSANPDESTHGAGFVARLSGSTAEFLSIWKLMFAGKRPFEYDGGRLKLKLRPRLPGWLFDEEGKVSFNFLNRCRVTLFNPKRKNTYGEDMEDSSTWKIEICDKDGIKTEIFGGTIDEPYSRLIREGMIEKVDIHLLISQRKTLYK